MYFTSCFTVHFPFPYSRTRALAQSVGNNLLLALNVSEFIFDYNFVNAFTLFTFHDNDFIIITKFYEPTLQNYFITIYDTVMRENCLEYFVGNTNWNFGRKFILKI